MKKYLLPFFLAFSIYSQSEETPCRVPSTPVTISSTPFTTFVSATLQPFTYSERLYLTQTLPSTLPLVYAGLTSNGSVNIGFTNNLSTPSSFEQPLSTSPSDSISISTLANISENPDGSNNHGVAVAWRDVASNKIQYATANITKSDVTLTSTLFLDSSNSVEINSLKVCSTQETQGPGYALLWTETDANNLKSLKYTLLSATASLEAPAINTAMQFGSAPLDYVTAEDCDGGLHVLAYSQQGGIYYMNKLATTDVMSSAVKVLPTLKPSSIQSASLAASKEGFVAIVVAYKDTNTGVSYLVTLHKYPSQEAPVEQDRQPIASLLEGKKIHLTIDPESNETTTVFIANKNSGAAAIHLYTRRTITIAPKDEMVSLPLTSFPNLTNVDILISHIDGTKEDIVGVTSDIPSPACISMRTVKYDFFSKFRQILPVERTAAVTHLNLEAVFKGVVISYLDETGSLNVSTVAVPVIQSDLTH